MTTAFRTTHQWLVVTSAARAKHLVCSTTTRPHIGAVISICDPSGRNRPSPEMLDGIPTLRLDFDDIEMPVEGHVEPSAEDVGRAIGFANSLRMGAGRRLLVHCAAGISRSTAIALAILCSRPGSHADGLSAWDELLAACEEGKPMPNLTITRWADDLLQTGGAITRVAESLNTRTGAALVRAVRAGLFDGRGGT